MPLSWHLNLTAFQSLPLYLPNTIQFVKKYTTTILDPSCVALPLFETCE